MRGALLPIAPGARKAQRARRCSPIGPTARALVRNEDRSCPGAAGLCGLASVGDAVATGALTCDEADRNGTGLGGFAEAFFAPDDAVRDVDVNLRRCREVFALKDGMPVEVRCPQGDRKTTPR